MPLQPAAGIGPASPRPRRSRSSAAGYLGLDLRRVGVVVFAVILPEAGRLGLQRIHDDQEFELGQRRGDLLAVRERQQRIEALAEIAVHLALVHQLEHAQHVVGRHVELRQPIIGEIVVRRRRRSPHRLLEAHEELLVVLPVADLVRPQRLEAAARHIDVEIGSLSVGSVR